MKKKRLIPLILFKNGHVVQSRGFANHRPLGLLNGTLTRMEDWQADEVVILDISPNGPSSGVRGRSDHATSFSSELIEAVSRHASLGSMPLTVGGGIRSRQQVENLFNAGADKVLVNSALHHDSSLIPNLVEEFGSQAIVLGVDYLEGPEGRTVMSEAGRKAHGTSISEILEIALGSNVGEVFLNSISRDGFKMGMDLELAQIIEGIPIPVVLCGGAGSPEHLAEALSFVGVDGVSAANFFQHVESSVPFARSKLLQLGYNVRAVNY
jgi:cyclase